jgi:signal transduction histidine kinase
MWTGHRSSPPPWWPANEPWPPADPSHVWRRGRARFMRRMAIGAALLLVLSAVGMITLLSTLVGGRNHVAAAIVPVILFAVTFAVVALFAAMRGVPRSIGDVVEASNRVAGGDYSIRIRPHGPPSLRAVGAAFNTMTARLETQDRQRRELMADIAHELRTPLSVIQGRLEGILDGIYARDDARLGEVLEETRMMARLVEDLRTLANAESGTFSLRKEPTDVAMLIRDTVASLAAAAAAQSVTIRSEVAADLPIVPLDPLRIREVLVNLLSNAVHHSPAGSTVAIAASASARQLTVTVTDNGPGIGAEDLPKVFDRFYKGAASRGSGLGLTIARNLVTAHGGEIRADSRPGEGTTITVTLPA